MSEIKKLQKGVAYHGNRFLSHVRDDMRDIVEHGFNTVVHMLSHTDWDRHKQTMKEIFNITKSYGLDVWVDNWGIAGGPGEKAHFLSYHPQAHQINSDGTMNPTRMCFNSPEFVQFTKDWVDVVAECGGEKIFWDEPGLLYSDDGENIKWTCRCDTCQKLFEERYNKPMPAILTPEVIEFRAWSVSNYFDIVSKYAKAAGMYNSICVILDDDALSRKEILASLCSVSALDNIGSDPYWTYHDGVVGYEKVYDFVYGRTKENLDVCDRYNKEHNVWIQAYAHKKGHEEEVIAAADAMYDAGARNIFVWGYRGCEGNDYKGECPDMLWANVGQAMQRITERWRNECRENACKNIK